MEKELNKNWKRRDEILGIDVNWGGGRFGGIFRIDRVSIDQLNTLKEENFLDPEENQNGAPTIGEIMEFLTKYPDCYAHGYVVSPFREDYRVSLEGVGCDGEKVTEEMKHDFVCLFRFADDFNINKGLYCWYD